MSFFSRYIGIDYSGAQTPTQSLKGLRIYMAKDNEVPQEVPPPLSPRRYWTRKEIAEFLETNLREPAPTLVGIDHGFSFPRKYFDKHDIPNNWDAFLEDFCAHWPTDDEHVYVDFIRDGSHGNGAARTGNPRWRRLTEERSRAKSVFQFDVQGAVAKSTHAGIPWLRRLRKIHGAAIHFWPFDGWIPKSDAHVVAEVYPSLWRGRYPVEGRTPDQHDAYTVCRWLQESDLSGELNRFFNPALTAKEQMTAKIEGWILGVA